MLAAGVLKDAPTPKAALALHVNSGTPSGMVDVYKRQGFDKYVAEANKGKGLKFAKWLKPYFQFILPALIVVIFLQGLL